MRRTLFIRFCQSHILVALVALLSGIYAAHSFRPLAGLAALLFAASVAWLMARRIGRPLTRLRHGGQRLAEGEFGERIPEEGDRELVDLAQVINRMAARFADRLTLVAQQHSQLQAVFSSMVEGVITVDIEERIVDLNQAGARMLQVEPEKAKGKGILMAVRNSALQRFVGRALTSAEPVEGEIDLAEGGGQEKSFYVHGARLHDSSGLVSGALIVINDVTSLRRLENIRRDFVANVSHELKTPITSIEGFAETLLDGALDEPDDARRFVEIIAKQSKRLHAIIEDLLTLSRLEQGEEKVAISRKREGVARILRSAVETCGVKATGKKIQIDLIVPNDLTAQVNGPLLEQAVTNLIVNAIKYSDEESRIEVRADKAEGMVAIEVRDFGVGIAPQHLPRLFERFYRSDAARSRRLGGTGLGLAIVKHIVQAHHGEVRVVSEVGQGSTFTILLPFGAD